LSILAAINFDMLGEAIANPVFLHSLYGIEFELGAMMLHPELTMGRFMLLLPCFSQGWEKELGIA